MKAIWTRIVLTVLFSLFSTATAAAFIYMLPVMAYVGYQSQIPSILIGFVLGALLFSAGGTLVSTYTSRPVLYGAIISSVLAVVLSVAYRLTGVTTDSDLVIGSFASQSFALLYASMFQHFQPEKRKALAAGAAVALFTVLNVVFFLILAVLYLMLGQAYLPNTIAYLEALCAALGVAALLLFSRGAQKTAST